MYDIEEEKILQEIRRRGLKRVILQLPEGLKPLAFELAQLIEQKTDAEVFLAGDPCYGACDLSLSAARLVGAELLIHIGHAQIPGEFADEKIMYVEAQSNARIEQPMLQALEMLTQEKIVGLASNIQHIHKIEQAKQILEEHGKQVLLGGPSGWLRYPGQVLGCDYGSVRAIAEKTDAIVILSGGDFHALGIPLATGRRTILVDPFRGIAKDMTEECRRLLAKRWAIIAKFKAAKKIGIIVGLKSSQMNISLARRLKRILKENGYEPQLICTTEVIPEALESFTDVEACVEISCPRISTDDQDRYTKPMLNPEEVMIAVGKKSWEDYAKGMMLEIWH